MSLKWAVLAVPGTKFGRREGRTCPPPKLEVPTVPCDVPKPSHLVLQAGGEPGPLGPGLSPEGGGQGKRPSMSQDAASLNQKRKNPASPKTGSPWGSAAHLATSLNAGCPQKRGDLHFFLCRSSASKLSTAETKRSRTRHL